MCYLITMKTNQMNIHDKITKLAKGCGCTVSLYPDRGTEPTYHIWRDEEELLSNATAEDAFTFLLESEKQKMKSSLAKMGINLTWG